MLTAAYWLSLNLLSIIMLSFYSMQEMACVSFNKVRLQYFVAKKNKRAEWLNWLLQNPTRLFGTTLIGVNVATFFGSEFSRKFHAAIGIDPDFSPLSQVFLVVIFGELAPMFAARRYAEHVAMLGIPIVYASARLLTPFLWLLGKITDVFNRVTGSKETQAHLFLTHEEIQKILEEQGEDRPVGAEEDFNVVTTNIFKLFEKDVSQIMEPITSIPRAPSNATVAQVGNILQRSDTDFVTIYHKEPHNIIGLAFACDLVRAPETRRVRDFSRPAWFLTRNTTLSQILNQFRRNQENLGIIIDKQGKAEGIIRLEDILVEIFGTIRGDPATDKKSPIPFIERTLPGFMKVGQFNERFDVILDNRVDLTLSELIAEELGHQPEIGESIYLSPFELKVESTTLLEVKSIKVTTIF